MELKSQIESLLFISTQPLSYKKIAQLCQVEVEKVEEVIKEIYEEYKERGIQLILDKEKVQMVTNPKNSKIVQKFLKEQMSSEITPAGLETLTIIAYRGPITKAELEQIRGVNCSLILRNLMIKGLIEAKEDKKDLVTRYQVSFDFIRYLGINKIEELPDYEKLRNDENLMKWIEQANKELNN